ncbi:MAG: hypothetical protein IT245_05285 [Bacteroidia bacterium]|nr:hypothetical protein [Bacteroidia bacterium]
MSACSKDDSGSNNDGNVALPAGPQDTVTSFMVFFTNTVDSSVEVGSYDDVDGPGPITPNLGGVVLKKNSTYVLSFFIEDGTGPSKVYLHTKIKNNGKDFKFCFSNPLGINVVSTDSDGSLPIGLVSTLNTSNSTGMDQLNFTIKYQKGVKNGSCSPGIVYHSCNIPIIIN